MNRFARAAVSIAALLQGCGWESLDAVIGADAVNAPEASDGSSAAAPETQAQSDAEADAYAEADADADAYADADADASPGHSPPTGDCTATGPYVDQWTFDSSLEGWAALSSPGALAALTWTPSIGQPLPGALEMDVTPAASDAGILSGGWVYLTLSLGNLKGDVASAWVWLDAGDAPRLKMYAQTGSQYVWADSGTVLLPTHEWTCVSLVVSSPTYQQASYDPTQVIRVGIEMLGLTPFRVYVDSVHVR